MKLFDATIPALDLALGNLAHIVDKGAAHCKDSGVEDNVMLGTRLYPDMLPFSAQINVATDISKGCGARLTDVEAPVFADDGDPAFADLIERINKTRTFLGSLDAELINAAEEKPITLNVPNLELKFSGADYVSKFVIPNVQFHVSIAYAILRANGVALGKRDFLGPIN